MLDEVASFDEIVRLVCLQLEATTELVGGGERKVRGE